MTILNVINRRLLPLLTSCFASSAAIAEDTNQSVCEGIDLSSPAIANAILTTRTPHTFLELAENLRPHQDCDDIVLELEEIADLHEINNILPIIDDEIREWMEAGRQSRYPKGTAIQHLNTVLSRLTTDEDFIVDDGFYTGTSTTLLQIGSSLIQSEKVRPLLNIRGFPYLNSYIAELSDQSNALDRALTTYTSLVADKALVDAFRICIVNEYFQDNESIKEFWQNYVNAKILDDYISDNRAIIEATGICAPFYSQMTSQTQTNMKNKLEEELSELFASPVKAPVTASAGLPNYSL